jgi:1,4-dihydroxy-2-naphthoyl-CoA synthase
MAQEFETVRLELADGVATLTLARPDRLNSFTVQMHGEVQQALDSAQAAWRVAKNGVWDRQQLAAMYAKRIGELEAEAKAP